MTPDPESAVHAFRLVLRSLAGLVVLLGLVLWSLARVSRRRGLQRDGPALIIGGVLALAGGGYLLWALP